MNKTVVFVTFAALAALGILGGILLLIHRPDATATFTNLLVLILGLVASSAGTFAVLGKVNEKVETIQQQTNGANSELRTEVARLNAELVVANRRLHPDNFDETTGATITPDEVTIN